MSKRNTDEFVVSTSSTTGPFRHGRLSLSKPRDMRKSSVPAVSTVSARPRRRIAGEPAPGTARPVPKKPSPNVTAPRLVAPSKRKVFKALVVGLIVAGLVLVGVATWRWLAAPDLTSAHDEATRAAVTATETIFTFSSNDLDAHSAASTAIMTDEFAEEFEQIAPALAGIAPDREFQVTSRVAEAAAVPCGSECSATRVTVLVFFDQARLVAGLDDPAVLDNRAEVTLVKSDGSWLVDDIRAL